MTSPRCESEAKSQCEECEDENEDPLEHFRAILKAIISEEIPRFALEVRRRLVDSVKRATSEVFESATVPSTPLTGSYHTLFLIEFNDGLILALIVESTTVQCVRVLTLTTRMKALFMRSLSHANIRSHSFERD